MNVKLVMFKQNGQRKDFSVTRESWIIGRGENCDLQVPIPSVSRKHCELTVEGDQLKVKDLASSNGTYVNNRRVHETELNAGDRFVVGPIVFTVQIDGEPAEITPVKTRGQKMAEEGEESEEIVDLEVDQGEEEQEGEDVDPIAALEMLAGEQDEERE